MNGAPGFSTRTASVSTRFCSLGSQLVRPPRHAMPSMLLLGTASKLEGLRLGNATVGICACMPARSKSPAQACMRACTRIRECKPDRVRLCMRAQAGLQVWAGAQTNR